MNSTIFDFYFTEVEKNKTARAEAKSTALLADHELKIRIQNLMQRSVMDLFAFAATKLPLEVYDYLIEVLGDETLSPEEKGLSLEIHRESVTILPDMKGSLSGEKTIKFKDPFVSVAYEELTQLTWYEIEMSIRPDNPKAIEIWFKTSANRDDPEQEMAKFSMLEILHRFYKSPDIIEEYGNKNSFMLCTLDWHGFLLD